MDHQRNESSARQGASHTTVLRAWGHAYPSDRVDNAEYVSRCRFAPSAGWDQLFVESRIRTRRWCTSGENTRTLAEAAVCSLLEGRPEIAEEIDVVVVASGTTMPMAHPSDPNNRSYADLSPLLARLLGREQALCLDIKACYCAGFLRGMQVVDALLANPNYRCGLLVATEQGSRFATAASNRTAFSGIVADAAGAALFRRVDSESPFDGASNAWPPAAAPRDAIGVVDYCGYTDVEKLDWVGIGPDADSIIMLGSRAAQATASMLIDCGRRLLDRNQLTPQDIDWFVPIQSHGALIDGVADALGFSSEKLMWKGDENGFSGSASIPACVSEQLALGRIRSGQRILSVAVGAGMNCAGAIYTC